jgi:hypothetical protein
MNDRIIYDIVFSKARDLRSLAAIAGGDPVSFFRGADFRGADLRNEDLRGFNLTGANFSGAIVDDTTLVDPEFQSLIDETKPISLTVSVDLKDTLGRIKDQSRIEGKSISNLVSRIVEDLTSKLLNDIEHRQYVKQAISEEEKRKAELSHLTYVYSWLLKGKPYTSEQQLSNNIRDLRRSHSRRSSIEFLLPVDIFHMLSYTADVMRVSTSELCEAMIVQYLNSRVARNNKKKPISMGAGASRRKQ